MSRLLALLALGALSGCAVASVAGPNARPLLYSSSTVLEYYWRCCALRVPAPAPALCPGLHCWPLLQHARRSAMVPFQPSLEVLQYLG